MANTVDITLRGNDETAGAYASATQRMSRYAQSAKRAGNDMQDMRRGVLGAGAAMQSLTMVLNGNIGALDNVGTSLGLVNPKLLALGSIIGTAGIGYQLGKMIGGLESVSKLLAHIGGTSPHLLKGIPDELARGNKELDAASRRSKELATARGALASAEIGLMEAWPGRNRATAAEAHRRELETIQQSIRDARHEVTKTQATLAGETDKKAIANAKAAMERAQKDLQAAEEAGAIKTAAANLRLAASYKDIANAVNDLKGKQKSLQSTIAQRAAEEAMKHHGGYVERITRGLDAFADPRTKALAQDALQGDRGADAVLQAKQRELGALDDLTAMRQQAESPAVRAERNEIERARRRTENQLKRAREREEAGRPLSSWEMELLKQSRAIDMREKERKQEAAAKEKLEKERAQAVIDNTANTFAQLVITNRMLEANLQAR